MQLNDLIEKTVVGLGFELVEVESSPRARLLRVFIDHPETDDQAVRGISVDDCSAVSHQLTHVFMVENIDYDRLEVSSPGLDRALTKVADFRRFTGREIQLKLRVPLGNQRNFKGVIEAVADDEAAGGGGSFSLRVEDVLHEMALANVDRARLVPTF
ncbi:MAG TPA: ribosome maturation factor RimP [Rugosibacter sp.]